MATLQDLIPGEQDDVWGDIVESNIVAVNDHLEATVARVDALPTAAYVNSTAAAEADRAIAASEPRVSRAGASQGYIVTLGAGGALTLSAPGSGGTAIPTASETVKGVLLLAGDLGGTSDLPTTPTAVHKTGNETISGIKTFTDQVIFQGGVDGVEGGGANVLGSLANPITDPNAVRPTGLTRVAWDTPTVPINKQPQDYNLQRGTA